MQTAVPAFLGRVALTMPSGVITLLLVHFVGAALTRFLQQTVVLYVRETVLEQRSMCENDLMWEALLWPFTLFVAWPAAALFLLVTGFIETTIHVIVFIVTYVVKYPIKFVDDIFTNALHV